MFRITLFFLLLFLSTNIAIAQSTTLEWVKQRGANNSSDQSRAMDIDKNGNLYYAGSFGNTVDFDPNAGIVNLTATGQTAACITKLDENGNLIWARHFSGSLVVDAYGISVDTAGNVYTVGYLLGSADFDPGTSVYNLTANGSSGDMFISKLDSNGNFVWAIKMGNTGGDGANDIIVDSSGNIYLIGHFSGTVDFDPGTGISNLSSTGSMDIFILKLTGNGNLIWAKRIGGTSNESATALALDMNENLYISGAFQNAVDFDPNVGSILLTSAGLFDAFLLLLNQNGVLLNVYNYGGQLDDFAYEVTVDNDNNVYLTGGFSDTVDFNNDAPIVNLISAGMSDIFVVKTAENGMFHWAKSMGGIGDDVGSCMDLDATGNLCLAGSFDNTADFDPGIGVVSYTSQGDYDIFIEKLDKNGDFVWAKTMGGTMDDHIFDIHTSKYFHGTGYFEFQSDFDPDTSNYTLTSTGGIDVFMLKLNHSSSNILNPDICYYDNYISPSTNYIWDSTGVYLDTLLNAQSCDSLISVFLNVIQPDTSLYISMANLYANATNSTFQWLDCTTGLPVNNEINYYFSPSQNGVYAVVVNTNGCLDTSACYSITDVGINDYSSTSSFSVFPNPSDGNFILNSNQNLSVNKICIKNLSGQLVFEKIIQNENQINCHLNLANGMYLIELYTQVNILEIKKILIEN